MRHEAKLGVRPAHFSDPAEFSPEKPRRTLKQRVQDLRIHLAERKKEEDIVDLTTLPTNPEGMSMQAYSDLWYDVYAQSLHKIQQERRELKARGSKGRHRIQEDVPYINRLFRSTRRADEDLASRQANHLLHGEGVTTIFSKDEAFDNARQAYIEELGTAPVLMDANRYNQTLNQLVTEYIKQARNDNPDSFSTKSQQQAHVTEAFRIAHRILDGDTASPAEFNSFELLPPSDSWSSRIYNLVTSDIPTVVKMGANGIKEVVKAGYEALPEQPRLKIAEGVQKVKDISLGTAVKLDIFHKQIPEKTRQATKAWTKFALGAGTAAAAGLGIFMAYKNVIPSDETQQSIINDLAAVLKGDNRKFS